MWGEHRLYAKHYPYEESIRIPYLVRAPGHLLAAPGRRAEQMILNIDLAPTLLDIAGVPIPETMQGQSFLPVMQSPEATGRQAWVYELFRDFPFGGRVPPHKALRTQRYKYIDWEVCRRPELYDLQKDPREMHNLFDTAATRLTTGLKAELEALKQRYRLVST
jgi:N-acetylglucosamine-6-sulfatase